MCIATITGDYSSLKQGKPVAPKPPKINPEDLKVSKKAKRCVRIHIKRIKKCLKKPKEEYTNCELMTDTRGMICLSKADVNVKAYCLSGMGPLAKYCNEEHTGEDQTICHATAKRAVVACDLLLPKDGDNVIEKRFFTEE